TIVLPHVSPEPTRQLPQLRGEWQRRNDHGELVRDPRRAEGSAGDERTLPGQGTGEQQRERALCPGWNRSPLARANSFIGQRYEQPAVHQRVPSLGDVASDRRPEVSGASGECENRKPRAQRSRSTEYAKGA